MARAGEEFTTNEPRVEKNAMRHLELVKANTTMKMKRVMKAEKKKKQK